METLIVVLALSLVAVLIHNQMLARKLGSVEQDAVNKIQELKHRLINITADIEMVTKDLNTERVRNAEVLSQKKSSETRLGQISENLVPFLQNCTHDPRNMHFLGNPIDYVAFDFDEGKITFLEIKSGNSKPSRRQKTVKHIIKSGRVYYEEIRINEKGVKSKKVDNDG